MNRTTAFLTAAAALLLIAFVLGLPKGAVAPPTPAPVVKVDWPPPSPPLVAISHPGSLTLAGKLSHPYLTPGTSDVYATLDVTAVEVPGSQRAPVNLALVIDRSGSMSGAKLANAKQAALRLVDQLGDDDRLAIVHFGSDVRSLASLMATPENRERMRRYLRDISEEGGTNIGEGLSTGLAQLDLARAQFKVNRLLLLTDGQPTVGLTSAGGLLQLVSNLRASGVSVTALGVGADFNEALLQRMADVGGGSYGFISAGASMAGIFEKDLKQAGTMVARTVSLSFTVPEGVALREVYGRPTSQQGRQVTVTLPDFSASQTEKLVMHFAVTPAAAVGSAVDVVDVHLTYRDLLADQEADAALKLAAMMTRDATLAANKRDGEAFVAATRARAALNYQRAAELMEQGDFRQATAQIKANEGLFDDAAAVGGAGAVKADQQQNAYWFGVATTAPQTAPSVQSEQRKALKVQSLRSAGRGDSVY